MKLQNRTILMTGGTSGIGLELAKHLLARGNVVIVTGRDQAKLDATKRAMPDIHISKSDVSDPAAIVTLHDAVIAQFPMLDTLINNAGIMRNLNLNQPRDLSDVTREIEINLSGPVRMVQQFLPHLKTRGEALIVNVSSGLAFVPPAHLARLQRDESGAAFLHAIAAGSACRNQCESDRTGATGRRDAAVPRRVRERDEGSEGDERNGAGPTRHRRDRSGAAGNPAGPVECAENHEPRGAAFHAQADGEDGSGEDVIGAFSAEVILWNTPHPSFPLKGGRGKFDEAPFFRPLPP